MEHAMTNGLYKNIEAFLKTNHNIASAADVVALAAARYAELAPLERGNLETPGAQQHLNERILPTIAFYDALQQSGFSKRDAETLLASYVYAETEKLATTYKKLGRLPFFWALLKPVIRRRMTESYTDEGWKKQWHAQKGDELAFDMQSCLYYDIFKKYGCAELCEIFCNVDIIAYGDMSRSVAFLRDKTIAKGDAVCDFRFAKNA